MIWIETEARAAIVGRARRGRAEGSSLSVSAAMALANAYHGSWKNRHETRPADLVEADRRARGAGLALPPRVRRAFLEDRHRELLPVILVGRHFDS